jgi:hypothetical protein
MKDIDLDPDHVKAVEGIAPDHDEKVTDLGYATTESVLLHLRLIEEIPFRL